MGKRARGVVVIVASEEERDSMTYTGVGCDELLNHAVQVAHQVGARIGASETSEIVRDHDLFPNLLVNHVALVQPVLHVRQHSTRQRARQAGRRERANSEYSASRRER